jgi:DNA-binding transcriptional LysR family regulator
VAFVGCGQRIALVPSALRRLAPENVVLRPLVEKVDVVTTAVAWNVDRLNPAVTTALDLIKAGVGGVASAGRRRA